MKLLQENLIFFAELIVQEILRKCQAESALKNGALTFLKSRIMSVSFYNCLIVSSVLYRFSCPYPHSRLGYSMDFGRTAPSMSRLFT